MDRADHEQEYADETLKVPETDVPEEIAETEQGTSKSEAENGAEAKDAAFSTESLLEKLAEAEQKRDEYLQLAQRVQADFDNFRRRNKSAVADAYKTSAADTVGAFLPVLDNLERALSSAQENNAPETFVKGIEMVLRQFKDCLYKLDVEEIDALGAPFDPELHNAVLRVDPEAEAQMNTVADVLQKGYKIGDKVIRYSMVKVYG